MTSDHVQAEQIRVAVVGDTTGAAGEISRGLRGSGFAVRAFSLAPGGAYDRVRDLRPAVVVLRAGARTFPLASAFARIAANGGPALVLLTPAGSRQAIKLALDTGALVHVVEPVAAQALAAAVRVAAARAVDLRRLNGELTRIRESLRERNVLDRAKAILMRRFGMDEEEAHRTLQRESRNRNRKLIDTAWHVLSADARLGGGPRSVGRAASSST
ncbi:MAG: ANTAR domain-containing protein [Armatimonadetes bacterium]|nr:ANTAR domain-containing protein [Armatimonadota bacterium]